MCARDRIGRQIKELKESQISLMPEGLEEKLTPQDLAATVFTHLGIDTGAHWVNGQGRPIPIVAENGRPIAELV